MMSCGENQFPDILQSGDDELYGGAGDDFLRGGDDDDVLAGEAGRDVFYFATSGFGDDSVEQFPPGKDVVVDFQRGADSIVGALEFADDTSNYGGFAAFDSNGNGRLDDNDRFVGVRNVTFEGATARSTVIDIGGFGQTVVGGPYAPGSDTLTVFGVSGLSATDFG